MAAVEVCFNGVWAPLRRGPVYRLAQPLRQLPGEGTLDYIARINEAADV